MEVAYMLVTVAFTLTAFFVGGYLAEKSEKEENSKRGFGYYEFNENTGRSEYVRSKKL